MLAIPTVGFNTPSALAAMIPAMVFFTRADTLSVWEVPVVLAMYMAFPLAGVITLPTVDTPMGNG